jgi:membrane fusion protein, multidrug efflux system
MSVASPRVLTEGQTSSEPHPVVAKAATRNPAKPYVILALVMAFAGLVYGAFVWATHGRENTDDAQVDADVVTVSARVAGSVLAVRVTDNQRVHKGDLLVEIDPSDLSAQEKQAEAELAAAKAQAAGADAQVRIVGATSKGGLSAARAQLSGSTQSVEGADAQIEVARAALQRARTEASRAELDLSRAQALHKDQAIPQSQLDTAASNAEAARAAVAQAEAQLKAATDQKRTAQTQIAEAQGRLEQSAPVDALLAAAQASAELAHARADAAQAALVLARSQLSYAKITAPTSGLLSRLAVRAGQLVQPGQQVVVIVPEQTYVLANFKETQVGRMRPGQHAEISVDAYPGRTFEGKVESTSAGTGARFSLLPPDNASGNFVKVVQRVPVKIAWVTVPPDVKLAAGMSADVTVDTR